jgi:hypothetical protein
VLSVFPPQGAFSINVRPGIEDPGMALLVSAFSDQRNRLFLVFLLKAEG